MISENFGPVGPKFLPDQNFPDMPNTPGTGSNIPISSYVAGIT